MKFFGAIMRDFTIRSAGQLSLVELAGIFGVTERTIQNWAGKAGLGSKKSYGLAEITRYRVKFLEEQVQQKEDVLRDAKLRKLEAEAKLAEIALAEKEGSLVTIDEVREQWAGTITRAKSRFLGIPDRLALELSQESDPRVIQARLTSVILEGLQELAG